MVWSSYESGSCANSTGLNSRINLNTTGKRANFVSIQLSHAVGTKTSDVYRIGTGYERIMAHHTRPPFAYAAEDHGRITKIDDTAKMIEVTYKDGKRISVNYGKTICSNSGGGFYLDQPMIHNSLKINQIIKPGDILLYNPQFFKVDPFTKQVDYKLGVNAYVALIDIDQTLEDSSIITKTLSEKLRFAPISVREIVLTNRATIHQYVSVGQHVKNVDPLITFDESEAGSFMDQGDSELAELLQKLNRATPKAQHDGEIVKIEVYYKCKLNEMTPTLSKFTKEASMDENAKAAFAKDSENAYEYSPNEPLSTDKIGIVNLDYNTVVIKFYIQHEIPVHAGSKIVISSSLKSVTGKVVPNDMYTEDGTIRVDAMMSYRSVLARIVNSPKLTGVYASIVEKMEKDVIALFEEE